MIEFPLTRTTLYGGDMLTILDTLPENHFHAVVCDPPYHLASIVERFGKEGSAPAKGETALAGAYKRASAGFMGREWDGGDIAFRPETWAKVLRVMRPGAHLVAFAATKNAHRMVCAIEDAGFEIRDSLAWMFGVGFPKSHSVDKATQKMVEARYGLAKCNCVERRNGRPSGGDAGCSYRQDVRVQRTSSESSPQTIGDSVVSVQTDNGPDSLRDVRQENHTETPGSSTLEKAFLFQDLRERGAEESGYGHAPLWSGVEESAGGNKSERQDLSGVRERTGERGPARPSPETVSVWRDESPGQSGRFMRKLSSQDRESDGTNSVLDPDRHFPRRIILDDYSGRREAVARICSWCGNPDGEWLESLAQLGSALKPAYEPICLARKPLSEKTIAANVLKWGCGALNIDATRIVVVDVDIGRWPANVLHDGSDEVIALFPDSAGQSGLVDGQTSANEVYGERGARPRAEPRNDSGSAARFFYSAKADADDRIGSKHPTVKPIDLMRWLTRLITPSGGLILDPFAGTGSTAEAAFYEGFTTTLIEREPEYQADIARRMKLIHAGHAERTRESLKARGKADLNPGPLFTT